MILDQDSSSRRIRLVVLKLFSIILRRKNETIYVYSNVEKSTSRQVSSYAEINQRRNSAQLTVDVGTGHQNQLSSPNDHKVFSSFDLRSKLLWH